MKNPAAASLSKWILQLQQQTTTESAIAFFIQTTGEPILYFKYLASQAWLVLEHTKNTAVSLYRPICLRLYEMDGLFHPSHLYQPEKIPTLQETITRHLETSDYALHYLNFNHQIMGFFAYTSPSEELKNKFFILDYYIKNFLWEQKWKQESQTEEVTGCLNQKFFLKTLFTEVSRARRLLLPVSLIVLQVDQLAAVEAAYGDYPAKLFTKALARIILKDARQYDTLGVLNNHRLALILPHTSESGAAKKAEKIRWTLQSSDFSKVFPAHERLSVSLGLVEYPRAGRSADQLLRFASKALDFAMHKCGGNIIAEAVPASGFKPDFQVQKSRYSSIRDLT